MFGGMSSGGNYPAENKSYCSTCNSWYLANLQHICPQLVKVDEARKKLEKFLGDDHEIHE